MSKFRVSIILAQDHFCFVLKFYVPFMVWMRSERKVVVVVVWIYTLEHDTYIHKTKTQQINDDVMYRKVRYLGGY